MFRSLRHTEPQKAQAALLPIRKTKGNSGRSERLFKDIELNIFDNGKPLPQGEIGEIVVKGDIVMKGYFNKPDKTAEAIQDGWLHTGDLGYIDEEGFLFIVDRLKDMIIRGGVNVYPKELENVIAGHPKVDSVAIIPEAHEKYGQVAKACIVLKIDKKCDQEEMLLFCKENMADYKVPEHYVFLESMPTNAIGKILKKELIRQLEEAKTDTGSTVYVAPLFEGMRDRFIPEKSEGVDAAVCYNITGKGGGKWTVTIKDQKMTLTEGLVESRRVYMVARDKDYHDIATGKLGGLTAVMTGKLKIEGDTGFMSNFRGMFQPLKIDTPEEKGLFDRLKSLVAILKFLLSKLFR